MNDLEIKSRIAVIEGHVIEHITGDSVFIFDNNLSDVTGVDEYIDYNPLDDALCFKFCYEDGIEIKKCITVVNGKMEWTGEYYARHPKNSSFGSIDKNPNKAVCLEKIEAHKEKTNDSN